jgi:hypothetical protein
VVTRLDYLAVVWVVPVVVAIRARRSAAAWWAGGFAALGLPAALWWYVQFGRITSTSAAVKSHYMQERVQRDGSWLSGDFVTSWSGDVVSYFSELVSDSTAPGLIDGTIGDLLALVLPALALGGLVVLLARRLVPGVIEATSEESTVREHDPRAIVALVTVAGMVVAKGVLDQLTEPDWSLAWYSAPTRVVVSVLVAVLGVRFVTFLWVRSRPLAIATIALAALALLPAQLTTWTRSPDEQRSNWYLYDQIDLAADELAGGGSDVRYGARDAGILGYRLDPASVVNLDGLTNDYDFGEFVVNEPFTRPRIEREGIEVFVGRLATEDFADLDCAEVLWRSPGEVVAGAGTSPVYILDTRGCLADVGS